MLTSSGQHSVTHSESVTGQYTVPSTQNNPSLSGHLCSSAPSHSSSVTLGQTAGHRHCIHTRLEVTCGKESTECSSRAGKRPRQPHPVQAPPPQELQQPKEQILLPSVTELQSSLGLEGTSRPHPCPGLGAPPWPGAPPGMGHPQLWAAVQHLTASENFLLTSDLNLLSFSSKPFPLVLSLSNHMKSQPSCCRGGGWLQALALMVGRAAQSLLNQSEGTAHTDSSPGLWQSHISSPTICSISAY